MRNCWFIIPVLFIVSCTQENIKPYKSGDLFVPGDLEVTLWAESPMLNNPTNLDVDARGRLWVTEAVNYRNYRNNDSFFLHRSAGDRVLILEDTNHDGKADVTKVFVQDSDLVAPIGIAVLGNKIVVSCSPNLIVYTDTNGDDVPDSKEMLLTGFGGKDHDHSLHAVYGGPDGNWYFNTGNAGPHVVKDKNGWTLRSGSMYTGGSPYNNENEGGMISDDGKVWTGGLALRIDSEGKNFKALAHNFRNSYEVFPDSYGNLWQNDNDDEVLSCRATWLMEGGNAGYFSTDGSRNWKADQRPGQEIPVAHWHQDDPGVMPNGVITGAGAPTGVVMIEGDELGERFRGMLLSADAGRNIIFGFHPQRKASGYDLGKSENFISSLDNGNENYVWNDSTLKEHKEKWFRPSDVAIGTDGAIYVADWYDPVVGGHLMEDSTGFGRIYRISRKNKKMESPKYDFSNVEGQIHGLKSAAVNVRYTAFQKLVASGKHAVGAVKQLLGDRNPYVQARAVWILSKIDPAATEKLLEDKDEMIRATAYRALRQVNANVTGYAKKMVDDPSPFVRREVAVSIADLPYEEKKPLVLQLLKNDDGEDRWFLETIGTAMKGHEAEMYAEIKVAYGEQNATKWNKKMAAYAWRLHPVTALSDLMTRASDSSLPLSERIRAVTAIGFIDDSSSIDQLRSLASSADTSIMAQAKFWISFKDPDAVSNTSTLDNAIIKLKNSKSGKTYDLLALLSLTPDTVKGKQLFAGYCGTCHRAGTMGNTFAPDLTFISRKYDDEQLVKAVIDPDAGIAFAYQPWQVTKKDGSLVFGFLVSDSKETITIRNIAGENVVVKKSLIAKVVKQQNSLMPSASQMGLSDQDLRNITGFLRVVGR